MSTYLLIAIALAGSITMFLIHRRRLKIEERERKKYEAHFSYIQELLRKPKSREMFLLIYINLDHLTNLPHQNIEKTSFLIGKFEQKYEDEFILTPKREK